MTATGNGPSAARILVVDDERAVRELLAEGLALYGFETRAAAGADEAFEALQAGGIHLVLSDIDMPGQDGLELLARIKVVVRRTRTARRVPSRRIATFGRWTFDASAMRLADQSGREIPVTCGEMALLRVFIEDPDRVLLRSQILSLTKRSDAEVFDRAIDVLVGRLRRKIEEDPKRPRLILTVRGEGYRFAADVKWSASTE